MTTLSAYHISDKFSSETVAEIHCSNSLGNSGKKHMYTALYYIIKRKTSSHSTLKYAKVMDSAPLNDSLNSMLHYQKENINSLLPPSHCACPIIPKFFTVIYFSPSPIS